MTNSNCNIKTDRDTFILEFVMSCNIILVLLLYIVISAMTLYNNMFSLLSNLEFQQENVISKKIYKITNCVATLYILQNFMSC